MRQKSTPATIKFPIKPIEPMDGIAMPSIQYLESSMIWNQLLQLFFGELGMISSKQSRRTMAKDWFSSVIDNFVAYTNDIVLLKIQQVFLISLTYLSYKENR